MQWLYYKTIKYIKTLNPDGIDVIVDNNTARENVERFFKNSGYGTETKEEEGTFVIEARQ